MIKSKIGVFTPPSNSVLQSDQKSQLRDKLKLAQALTNSQLLLKTHNALVSRLWEIQQEIANKARSLRPEDKKAVPHLEKRATAIMNHLEKIQSSELLQKQFEEIEILYKKIFPESKLDFSEPTQLENLLLSG